MKKGTWRDKFDKKENQEQEADDKDIDDCKTYDFSQKTPVDSKKKEEETADGPPEKDE